MDNSITLKGDMMNVMRRVLFIFGVIVFPFSAVHADPFSMHFTVSGFSPSDGVAAPTDPVTGTFVWDAASVGAPIQSLISVSMTIDAHSYALGELAYQTPLSPNTNMIYGALNGETIVEETNDFWLRWDPTTQSPLDFVYSSEKLLGQWTQGSFTAFNITSGLGNPVPEPSMIALLGIGLAALIGWRRRSPRLTRL